MTSDDAYRVLMQIRRASGKKKLEILAKYPQLKLILNYALNPYITFGVTAPGLTGTGTGVFYNSGIKEILDDLADRTLSGGKAQRVLYDTYGHLTPESGLLLDIILDKKPRIGIATKSINKIWPGCIPTHDVMLAQKWEPSRCRFPCLVEPKIDGLRATYIKGELYTRKGLKLQGLDHIKEQLRSLPPLEWDGELTVPGCTFQKASGLLRSDADVPDAVFTIFAVRGEGKHIGLNSSHVKFIEGVQCDNLDKVNEAYAEYRTQGYEGAIVKSSPISYEYKRSYKWMKMKPLEDGEFEVIGMYEGKGKYEGMLGGLTVDFNGLPNDVGGGFTDEQRHQFWETDDIIGQMVTVEYMELTDDGNMRHSRFKDIRWDK